MNRRLRRKHDSRPRLPLDSGPVSGYGAYMRLPESPMALERPRKGTKLVGRRSVKQGRTARRALCRGKPQRYIFSLQRRLKIDGSASLGCGDAPSRLIGAPILVAIACAGCLRKLAPPTPLLDSGLRRNYAQSGRIASCGVAGRNTVRCLLKR